VEELLLVKMWQCICGLYNSVSLKLEAMKRVIVCFGFLFSVALSASAQTPGKTGVKKQQVTNRGVSSNNTKIKKQSTTSSDKARGTRTELTSMGTYNALGNAPTEQEKLSIADPVIRTLNDRAYSPSGVEVPGSGILGMPKLTYGIARGHIIFRSTNAPTMGTSTGSGSVGTGTNVGALGASGNSIGVNGKNPYAGPGIYGLPLTDETGTKVTVEGSRPKGVRRKE
jgi:hypothetical protein